MSKLKLLTIAAIAFAPACRTPSTASLVQDDALATADESTYSTGGTWHPVVTVRDATTTFVDASTADGQPQAGGWYVTPIHAVLLASTGQVLLTGWGRKDPTTCHVHGSPLPGGGEDPLMGTRRNGTSWVVDPATFDAVPTMNVTPLNEQPLYAGDVLYCSGQTLLPDGRVLYVGGATYDHLGDANLEVEYGIDYARIFDPATASFSQVAQHFTDGPVYPPAAPPPTGQAPWPLLPTRLRTDDPTRFSGMWYPTATRMPDGRILVASGFAKCCDKADSRLDFFPNNALHIVDAGAAGGPAVSTLLSNDDSSTLITPGQKDYTQTHLLYAPVTVGGVAYQAAMFGYRGQIMLLNIQTGALIPAPNGQRPGSGGGAAAWDATSALVSTGEIMIFGGSSDETVAQGADFYNPATATWRHIDTGIGRENSVSILMPDGKVMLINGWDDGQQVSGDRRAPVLLDPDPTLAPAAAVQTLPSWPESEPERGYHSWAILLKDARILLGGGTHDPEADGSADIGCEQPTLRAYDPPYPAGARPQLVGAEPISLVAGAAPVTLTMASAVPLDPRHGVALLAPSSMTHAFNENQRYVPLPFSQNGAQLTVTPPTDTQLAPVGQYLLFLISASGTPSVGYLTAVGQ